MSPCAAPDPVPVAPAGPGAESARPGCLGRRVLASLAAVLAVGGIASACGSDDGDTNQAVQSESGFEDDEGDDANSADAAAQGVGGLDPALNSGDDKEGKGDEGDEGDEGSATSIEAQGEPSEQTPTSAAPDTAAPAGNLITDDASPALDGLATAIGADYQATELVLYPEYAILTYQDPAAPENIDTRTWRNGSAGPAEPDGLTADGYEEALFPVGDVAFDTIPGLAQQALEGFALDGGEVTHVIIDRFFGLDDGSIGIRVYVSHPERGGGGYLLARADGSVVELIG